MSRYSYILVAFTAALSACGGGSQSSDNTAAAPASAPIAIGEVGSASGIEFTVTKVTTPKGIEYGPQTKSGETLVIVGYQLKNKAETPLNRAGFVGGPNS